jgi:hypothetical protein
MTTSDTTAFAQLVQRARGAQAVATALAVGKVWAYRPINGETSIKKKDELLVTQVKPKKRKSAG